MADLLFMPTDKKGNKYLLVVDDLATDEFDVEPLKDKEAKSVLAGLKAMYKRPYIKAPHSSIRTDDGNEFEGVFQKYLYDESIYHSVARAGRHKQTGNVESLNKQLGRIFNGYMNKIELETAKPYREWTDILPCVRKELNKIRKKPEKDPFTQPSEPVAGSDKTKFKVGDLVHVKLEQPKNALNKKVHGESFRMGDFRLDTVPRKITRVLFYSGAVPHRYLVNGVKGASFTDEELVKSKGDVEKHVIKEIVDKKKVKNVIYYKIWWQGKPKKNASWEPKSELIKDVPILIKVYEESLKKKNESILL